MQPDVRRTGSESLRRRHTIDTTCPALQEVSEDADEDGRRLAQSRAVSDILEPCVSSATDQPSLERTSASLPDGLSPGASGRMKLQRGRQSLSGDLSVLASGLIRTMKGFGRHITPGGWSQRRNTMADFPRERPFIPIPQRGNTTNLGDRSNISNAEASLQRCSEMLENLDAVSTEELHEDLQDLFFYKNRWCKGQLLHHAIFLDWRHGNEHATTVRRVLQKRADPNAKASYVRQKQQINILEAIHIAAGLGHVPSMRALVEKVPDTVALLNTYCMLDQEEFYAPIHDAAYNGKREAVVWLLENRADASLKNRDGYTPLHWLAKKGLEPEGDLEVMVRSLLKYKARLDVRTNKERKIPLELAAADDSSFPRRLVHLLAPSFQAGERGGYSFFDDMCVLSSLNMAAADQLAHQLLESEDPSCHERVRADAQKENAVDRMANLFHMAPEAAADMLQILLVKPIVKDTGHHPIRSRASLWGLFYSRAMRCEYQSDAEERGDKIVWPVWMYDSTCKDDPFLKEQPKLHWHLRLVKTPDDSEERREYVDDVDTKVCLLPNILDIDIFMALSCTGQNHNRIFSKLPVQGIICCLWDHLMLPAVMTRLVFNSLDLAVHSAWGMTDVGPDNSGGDTNSPLCAPVWWSILMAGMLRDLVNLIWWFCAFYEKWKGHYKNFQQWQTLMKEPATPRARAPSETPSFPTQMTSAPQTLASAQKAQQRPPSLHALWRPQAFFTYGIFFCELPMYLAKAYFLWDVSGLGNGDPSAQMDNIQQAMLTASALLTFFKLIYMLRLTNGCKRVTTILKAFVCGAIREMFLVASLFFSAVVLAFKILKRKNTSQWIGLHLYRGLLFGDGAALDAMGLDPEKMEDGALVKTIMMIAATVLFNIVILNLTVAVYSSEYDRIERESEVHLQRERAKTCCELLLSLQKIKLKGDDSDEWRVMVAKVGTAYAVVIAAALLWPDIAASLVNHWGFWVACLLVFLLVQKITLKGDACKVLKRIRVCKVCVAFVVPIASALLWQQLGAAAGLVKLRCFLAACLFAFAQITFQAINMASHWFPGRENGVEGPDNAHFLWICHRSGYGEESNDSDLDKDAIQDIIDERVGKLDERLNTRISRLDGRVEELSAQMECKIDSLGSQLREVISLLKPPAEAAARPPAEAAGRPPPAEASVGDG